jgi:hypothetical protein
MTARDWRAILAAAFAIAGGAVLAVQMWQDWRT